MRTRFQLVQDGVLPESASANQSLSSLRVLTLNIAHGRAEAAHQLFLGTDRIKKNLEIVAELLKQQRVHIAALQEVDARSIWNGAFDHSEFLAHRAGYPYRLLGDHMDRIRLKYGTALLAKLALSEADSFGFRSPGILPPKGFVIARSVWPGTHLEFDVLSLHLDFLRARNRLHQVQEIITVCEERKRPLVVLGDFNSTWGERGSAVRTLAQELKLLTFEPLDQTLNTFPLRSRRWDWILISAEFRFRAYHVLTRRCSDHLAVFAELELA